MFPTKTPRYWLFCLILSGTFSLFLPSPGLGMPVDSLKIQEYKLEYRSIDSARLAAYAADPDFDYTVSPPKRSLFQRFLDWLRRTLDRDGTRSDTLAKVIGYGLAIFFVALLVFQLLKVPIQGLWSRKASALDDPLQTVLGEEMLEWDFDERIATSEAEGNYRKALRLLFLESLKILAAHELIEWKSHKTNRAYEKELRDSPYESAFRKLRQSFEYVWYGDFPLNEETYHKNSQIFKDFRTIVEEKAVLSK